MDDGISEAIRPSSARLRPVAASPAVHGPAVS